MNLLKKLIFLNLFSLAVTACSNKNSCETLEECLIDGRFRMTNMIDHKEEFIIHFQKDSVCNLIGRIDGKEESFPDKWYVSHRDNKDFLVVYRLTLVGSKEIVSWNVDEFVLKGEDDILENWKRIK